MCAGRAALIYLGFRVWGLGFSRLTRTSGATHRGPLFVCTVNVFAQRSSPYFFIADPAHSPLGESAGRTDSKQGASGSGSARTCARLLQRLLLAEFVWVWRAYAGLFLEVFPRLEVRCC
jgi:hypothetical protein